MQNNLIHAIDQKGGKVEDVIAKWIEENEAVWGPWVAAAEAAKS